MTPARRRKFRRAASRISGTTGASQEMAKLQIQCQRLVTFMRGRDIKFVLPSAGSGDYCVPGGHLLRRLPNLIFRV